MRYTLSNPSQAVYIPRVYQRTNDKCSTLGLAYHFKNLPVGYFQYDSSRARQSEKDRYDTSPTHRSKQMRRMRPLDRRDGSSGSGTSCLEHRYRSNERPHPWQRQRRQSFYCSTSRSSRRGRVGLKSQGPLVTSSSPSHATHMDSLGLKVYIDRNQAVTVHHCCVHSHPIYSTRQKIA